MMEHSQLSEIEAQTFVWAMAFVANGEYLVSGDDEEVRVWRVRDGMQMTRVAAENVRCLAVSKDGRWIAAGTSYGAHNVFVWDATTYERVFVRKEGEITNGVDFSPDSTRLLTASSNGSASAWDIATQNRVLGPLRHRNSATTAKYSPQGDRVATATLFCVHVYDSHDGRLLVNIPVGVIPDYNTGLLWSGDQFCIVSYNTIKRVDASTGSVVAEWPVLDTNGLSCIAISQSREFIAYSTTRTVSFWETSTYTQLGFIQHAKGIRSIAFSSNDQFLAIGGDQKIAIHRLSHIADSVPLPRPRPKSQELCVLIDNAELQHHQPTRMGALPTETLFTSQKPSHYIFASRAFARTRLRQWDAAIDDADQSIKIQPSLIGYIAKSVALIGKGEREKGYRMCDIAFVYFQSTHASFLLIKAVIIFMAGEHIDAISRIDDLITTTPFNSVSHAVQAHMYLLHGCSQMGSSDYEGAMESFRCAQSRVHHCGDQALLVISLISGWKFHHLEIKIRQHLCEALYAVGHTKEAIEFFLEMINTFDKEAYVSEPILEWVSAFKFRCCEKLKQFGDAAMDVQRHDEADTQYSVALSLNPDSQDLFIRRSKARMAKGLLDEALIDVNEAIARDPSSPWGYEAKHAVLHGVKRYADATSAFEIMFSKMVQSPDPKIRDCHGQYISPSNTRAKIRRIVQRTIRRSPRLLINISTGRLQNRAEQASAFQSSPVFTELLSSMTTRVDGARIKREVKQFFRYVMLSHKWEDNEPLFQQVIHVAVYDMDKSPTHDKLQMFCKIVRDAGFNWAWSDTCCIDKQDHFVLQEALVAMFKWYHNSAMVIVYLRGVRSPARLGDLVRSVWNTRAWTFQEYVAGKVIHFYTEDWIPYLDLEIPNHKESPEIISEMEQATGVSADQLMALRPGLGNIREKLCLASTRETTLVEDTAYSLLGIFSVTGILPNYGEGESAVGRLLAHILSSSGDASILAWTGQSSSVNSCLPSRISVYGRSATLHLPLRIADDEMEKTVSSFHDSALDLDLAVRLYRRLNELSTPWFAANRLKLPCLAFKLPPFLPHQTGSGRVYRAETPAFGMVEIKTRRDLSRLRGLYLVHPWLDALLGREDMHVGAFMEDDVEEPSSSGPDDDDTDDADVEDDSSLPPEPELSLPPTPVDAIPLDSETRALQLIARLRQPFGALLFMLASMGGREVYKRVVPDSLITVQMQANVSLDELLENVRMLDVL